MFWRDRRLLSIGCGARSSPSTRSTFRPTCSPDLSKSIRRACCGRSSRRGRSSFRSNGSCAGANVLKGTRDGILKKVQPVSIHGQVSWDVFFTDVEDPDGQVTVARIGPEAVIGNNLEPGDRIQVEYLVGQAVRVTRVVPTT